MNFNLGLVEQGYELYILPYLINRKFKRITFPPQVVVNFIIKNWYYFLISLITCKSIFININSDSY